MVTDRWILFHRVVQGRDLFRVKKPFYRNESICVIGSFLLCAKLKTHSIPSRLFSGSV